MEVDLHVWDTLSARQKSQKSKDKSKHMQAISKGNGSKEAQMRAIEKTIIGELVRVSIIASHSNVPMDISVCIGMSVYSL